jgi:hypothetical protein
MDMKNYFLHGEISLDIYMDKPLGFIHNSYLVCKLKKSLYGLKQAPRAWYDFYFLSHEFVRCKYDSNVYMLRTTVSVMILVLYVDDLLITGSSTSAIYFIKDSLHDRFSMTYMGPLNFFLSIEIN